MRHETLNFSIPVNTYMHPYSTSMLFISYVLTANQCTLRIRQCYCCPGRLRVFI